MANLRKILAGPLKRIQQSLRAIMPLRYWVMVGAVVLMATEASFLLTDQSGELARDRAQNATVFHDETIALDGDFMAIRGLNNGFQVRADLDLRSIYKAETKEARARIYQMIAMDSSDLLMGDLITIRENLGRHEAAFDAMIAHSVRLGLNAGSGVKALMAQSYAAMAVLSENSQDPRVAEVVTDIFHAQRTLLITGNGMDATEIETKLALLEAMIPTAFTNDADEQAMMSGFLIYKADLARLQTHATARQDAIAVMSGLEKALSKDLDGLIIKANQEWIKARGAMAAVIESNGTKNWLAASVAALILLAFGVIVARDTVQWLARREETRVMPTELAYVKEPVAANQSRSMTGEAANQPGFRIHGVRTRLMG